MECRLVTRAAEDDNLGFRARVYGMGYEVYKFYMIFI